MGVGRFKVYAGDTKINIDYNRFDYSLVYIRFLEELQYRRIRSRTSRSMTPSGKPPHEHFVTCLQLMPIRTTKRSMMLIPKNWIDSKLWYSRQSPMSIRLGIVLRLVDSSDWQWWLYRTE